MWYLMSAYAVTEKRVCPFSDIAQHWTGTVVTVFCVRSARSSKKMFAVGYGTGYGVNVGDKVKWTQDTGIGHRDPGYSHNELIVEEIIEMNSGKVFREAVGGFQNEKRPIYVFK